VCVVPLYFLVRCFFSTFEHTNHSRFLPHSSQDKKLACDLNVAPNCPLHVKGNVNTLGQWVTSKNSVFDHGLECMGCLPTHTVLSLSNLTFCKLAGKANSKLNSVALTELIRGEIGGQLPSARGMRTVTKAVTTQANDAVFESAPKDFQAIQSACEDFMEKNPGSHASAHNDSENCFASFTIVFRDNARRASRASNL